MLKQVEVKKQFYRWSSRYMGLECTNTTIRKIESHNKTGSREIDGVDLILMGFCKLCNWILLFTMTMV
jgi:hypothetical protein